MNETPNKRVILLGAGAAHMQAALRARRFAEAGIELMMIEPGVYWHAPLAAAALGGKYDREDIVLNPQRVVEACGGTFVKTDASRIDPALQQVYLADGNGVGYDALSLELPPSVDLTAPQGAAAHAMPVRPLVNLWRLRQRLEDCFRAHPSKPVRIVVIGAGESGCEIAANIEALSRRHLAAADVTLIGNAPRLLPRHGRLAARAMGEFYKSVGLRVFTDTRVTRITETFVETHDHRRLPCELAIAATGLKPHPMIAGAPGDPGVNDTLQWRGRHNIFAPPSADAADVLTGNLIAAVQGDALQSHSAPQREPLSISLGDDTAISTWGPLARRSRGAMRAKDRRERKWLNRFHRAVAASAKPS